MKRTRKRNPLAWFFYLIIFLLILILIELVILCVTIVRRGSSQGAQMSQTVQSADAGQHSSMASADDPQQMTQTEIAGQAPQTETDLMQTAITEEATEAQTAAPQANTDLLLILVNASHPLPDNYTVDLVQLANGKQIASLIYPDLQRMFDAARAQGIYPTVTEGYRTHEDQIAMMQNYINRYIAEGYSESDAQQMALDYVAVPGTSEHELGIAADINSQDGNTDWNVYAWLKDNAHNYGFILRYLDGKEHITGYGYEPWHIRYIDNADTANEITSKGVTFEEYLGAVKSSDVKIDLGSSEIFSEDELKEAVIQIKCKFASFRDCELHSITYAGDETCSDENIARMNDLDEGAEYTQAIKFTSEFHAYNSPVFDPDSEQKDYEWWLARGGEDGWQLVTWGY